MPPTDRRAFLHTLGAATLAAGLDRAGIGLRPRPAATLDRIGLQLYTVRGALERDFEGTLNRVAAIGYREVEFAGYYGKTPHDVWAALERRGLAAPSAHVPFEPLKGSWRGALEDARVIGHRYVVVPWLPPAERRSLDGYKRVARLFNRAGAVARDLGLQFAYHNHDFEFARLGGRVPYDVLLAETDPKLVALELDLYWITKGGGKPPRAGRGRCAPGARPAPARRGRGDRRDDHPRDRHPGCERGPRARVRRSPARRVVPRRRARALPRGTRRRGRAEPRSLRRRL